MASRNLVVRAGVRASERLRDEGLHGELFDTLVGASGGPKWLVLRHLDDVVLDRVILARSRPIDTIGSSIGSFRHACFAQNDPHAALSRFGESYVAQSYTDRPTMEAISRESDRILGQFLGESGTAEIVDNPLVRNHLIAARLQNDRGRDRGATFQLQLAAAAGWNLLSRPRLGRSFQRILFQPENTSIRFDDFKTVETPLTQENLRLALLASGSIPMAMAGVTSVPGVGGMLFDGGIIDYHFDFSFRRREGLVLFPHFFDRITPGWFDKPLRHRKPGSQALADVVMIAPSNEFVKNRLPGGKVPDRNDFLKLETHERISQWLKVMDECRVLADELNDLFDQKDISDRIESFAA